MIVNLTPDQERLVREELRVGHYRTAEEVIARALEVLRDTEHALNQTQQRAPAQRQAVQEMLDFVEKNHTPLVDISVKDLIHEGHRL
jgi:Arc/MetJ-type ribon-helix-helix transcriptional regulator